MLSHANAPVKDLVSALSQLTAGPDITAVTGTSAGAGIWLRIQPFRCGGRYLRLDPHGAGLGASSPRGPVRLRSMPGAPASKRTAPGGFRRRPCGLKRPGARYGALRLKSTRTIGSNSVSAAGRAVWRICRRRAFEVLPHVTQSTWGGGPKRSSRPTKSASFVMTMASAFRVARYLQPKHEVAPELLRAAEAVHTFNKPPAHPGLDLPVKAPGGRHLTSFPVHQLAPRIP